MSPKLPTNTKAIIIEESKVPRTPLYHDASLIDRPLSPPKPGEVVVKIEAVGFNHKDVRASSYSLGYFDVDFVIGVAS